MTGRAVALVVESAHPEFPIRRCGRGDAGWQEYAVAQGRDLRNSTSARTDLDGSRVLGMPGLTAYFGLLDHL